MQAVYPGSSHKPLQLSPSQHTTHLSETELEELASEARLLKKFKAGKVSTQLQRIIQAWIVLFPPPKQISKAELEAKLDTD